VLLEGLGSLGGAAPDLRPDLRGLRGLVAQLAHRWLGEGDPLEAEVGLSVDGLPLHALDGSVGGADDSLFAGSVATLLDLKIHHSGRERDRSELGGFHNIFPDFHQ